MLVESSRRGFALRLSGIRVLFPRRAGGGNRCTLATPNSPKNPRCPMPTSTSTSRRRSSENCPIIPLNRFREHQGNGVPARLGSQCKNNLLSLDSITISLVAGTCFP